MIRALALVVLLSGCGSVIQTHARAAAIASVTTATAAELVSDSARLDAQMTCPHDRYPVGSAALRECLDPLRERWAPADAAVVSTRAALGIWVESLELARIAGDGADLWRPLATAAARAIRAYQALVAVLQALGVDVPLLPAVVVSAADALGGE